MPTSEHAARDSTQAGATAPSAVHQDVNAGLVSALKNLGVAIGVVGALFTVVKAGSDLNTSTQHDLRGQISDAVAFYNGAAERATRLSSASEPARSELLLTSLRGAVLQPPPVLDAGFFTPAFQRMTESGYAAICQARQYAIDTHRASADPATQARMDAFMSDEAEVAPRFARFCGKLQKAVAAKGADSLSAAVQAAVPAPPPVIGMKVYNRQKIAANGWDVDILPCSGAANAQAAATIASALALKADKGERVAGELLGQVRTRPGSGTASNVVFFDAPEQAMAQGLATFAGRLVAKPFSVQPNAGDRSLWYVSVFVCAS